MPLRFEAYKPFSRDWIDTGSLPPGADVSSLVNYTPDGRKEILIFDCANDNSESTITTITSGAELAQDIPIPHSIGGELCEIDAVTLKKGEFHFIEARKNAAGNQLRIIKVTHI